MAGAFAAATLTGLLGSLHCIGMCGATAASIISARAGLAAPPKGTTVQIVQLATHAVGAGRHTPFSSGTQSAGVTARASLAFNAGRVTSYLVAGLIVAGVADTLSGRIVMADVMPLRLALFIFGQCLVIATGLYIAGFTKPLAPFERLGQVFWRVIQRRMAPLLRSHVAHGNGNMLLLGALWGWIPCGLVYGTLATAMASGSAGGGALIMLGFGLGTMPAMFAAGTAAAPLRRLAARPKARLAAGAVVVVLGLIGLARSTSLSDMAAFGAFCSSAIGSVFTGAAP